MIAPQLLEFLAARGAAAAPHSGHRTLLEHLVSTHALLRKWRADEAVCLAGLFHSVYGTSVYRRESVPLAERSRVAALIGDAAERLAFLFCVADRPRVWHQPSLGPFQRLPTRFGGAVTVGRRDLGQLMQIECANLLEQPGGKPWLHAIERLVLRQRIPVTSACRKALETHGPRREIRH